MRVRFIDGLYRVAFWSLVAAAVLALILLFGVIRILTSQ